MSPEDLGRVGLEYGADVARVLLRGGRVERHLNERQLRDLVGGAFLRGVEFARLAHAAGRTLPPMPPAKPE
jgi:hypothetical protein